MYTWLLHVLLLQEPLPKPKIKIGIPPPNKTLPTPPRPPPQSHPPTDNLKVRDLAFRFEISMSTVSHYVTIWICFLYHHLKELDRTPSVEQVMGTLLKSFRQQYPTTYAIIDGSEIVIQTPSDLHVQSSTWSQYKHHNTAKFLIGCTPNGAVSFISQVFVGSISEVELTKMSGFLTTLEDKPGISIMADWGFTIMDLLQKLNIELNMPPFLEGKWQFSTEKV